MVDEKSLYVYILYHSIGLQTVGHDWATDSFFKYYITYISFLFSSSIFQKKNCQPDWWTLAIFCCRQSKVILYVLELLSEHPSGSQIKHLSWRVLGIDWPLWFSESMKWFLSYDDIFIGYCREIQSVFTDCWKKSVFLFFFFLFFKNQFFKLIFFFLVGSPFPLYVHWELLKPTNITF